MPSPFPGMDPYLENPLVWADVHHGLISEMQNSLNQQLRPRYYATVEERVYITDEDDPGREVIIPDVRIADAPGEEWRKLGAVEGATVTVTEPVEITLLEDEVHEARVEVVDAKTKHVITVIEIVSPSNKVPGSSGRTSFLSKRREVKQSPSHWVEIDLLRAGARFHSKPSLRQYEYLVHVSRANHSRRSLAWPVHLRERLPVIGIPLKKGDDDAKVDLQNVLSTAYERGAYDLRIDYGEPCVPPLRGEQVAWASKLVRGEGRR